MKNFIMIMIAIMLVPVLAFAGGIDSVWPMLGPVLLGYADQYPIIFTIIMYMGTARLVMKPLMSLILVIVDITPSNSDNEFLEKLQNYKWYKMLSYLLDWSVSVKLPKK